MSKQAMEIIEDVANNLGEFAAAMETQHKADVLSQYASELFNCAILLKEAIKQHDAEPVAIPDVLFDGFAVYQVMDDRVKARTSPENVSDTLDAVVKLMRSPAYIFASPQPTKETQNDR